MSLLTPEESQRAWNRLKRGGYCPIILGMFNGTETSANGRAIHMAKGLMGLSSAAEGMVDPELVTIARRAASLVSRRVFVDAKEVRVFLKRNINRIQEAK